MANLFYKKKFFSTKVINIYSKRISSGTNKLSLDSNKIVRTSVNHLNLGIPKLVVDKIITLVHNKEIYSFFF